MIRPMLAATLTEADLQNLAFPLIASPKLDGIRCVIHPELGAVSRKLKPIPNYHIFTELSKLPPGLDGEILSGDTFQDTTSAVMSYFGRPQFVYWVFDSFAIPTAPYIARMPILQENPLVKLLDYTYVHNSDDILSYEASCLSLGYEGIILRNPQGSYKFGRSTIREGYLLKLKRFEDAEGTITNFTERYTNQNEATTDELGYTKRSSHQENQLPTNMLGSLEIVCDAFMSPFHIGTGFTESQRIDLWKERDNLVGKVVKFKFQQIGVKDVPRFPIFLGFRED